MDVYELIIREGTLGAIAYANQIENKNYRLASKIDDAVMSMCRNAGMVRTAQDIEDIPWDYSAPRQSYPSYSYSAPSQPSYNPAPNYDPSEYNNGYYRPKGEKKDDNNAGWVPGLASGAVPLAMYQAGKRGLLSKIFNAKLQTFENLLKDGRFSEATEILNNTPKELNFTKPELIRKKFLDVAEKTLGKGSAEYEKFAVDAAGSLKQNLYKNVIESKYTKKIPGIKYTALGNDWHPAIQQVSEFENLTPSQKNMLRGKTIEEIAEIVNNPGNKFPFKFNLGELSKLENLTPAQKNMLSGVKNLDEIAEIVNNPNNKFTFKFNSEAALSELEKLTPAQKNMLSGVKNFDEMAEIVKNFKFNQEGLLSSEKFLQKAPSAKEGVLKQGLQLAAEKFPALGKVLPTLGKVLGPLALFLEGKGFFDDVTKYGWDNKTICDFLSLLAGAVTVVAPLAGPAGVAVAAVSGIIWAVIGVGCMWVEHGKPLEDKTESQDKESVADISDANVEALAGKVKMSDLSQDDQNKAQEIYESYKNDPEEMTDEFNRQAMGGRFDKPVSVLAGVEKQLNGGQFFN